MKDQRVLNQCHQFLAILVIVAVVLYLNFHSKAWLALALGASVVSLFFPTAIKPALNAWMKLGLALSWVMTRVLFSSVFFLVVLPISLFKKSQLRKGFGIGHRKSAETDSTFKVRDHTFTKEDFAHPF